MPNLTQIFIHERFLHIHQPNIFDVRSNISDWEYFPGLQPIRAMSNGLQSLLSPARSSQFLSAPTQLTGNGNVLLRPAGARYYYRSTYGALIQQRYSSLPTVITDTAQYSYHQTLLLLHMATYFFFKMYLTFKVLI